MRLQITGYPGLPGIKAGTGRPPRPADDKSRLRQATILLLVTCCLLFAASGCSVTYPKEKLKESVVNICKNEYKIDVKVETVGNTIAIYLPLEDLLDFSFGITKSAGDKINDVILSVTRVVLSTDAKSRFYCIIAHDIRIPEIQVVIIKSVSDVKRLLLNDISRGEYSKRILIDMRISPQSQKERSIQEVFQKMSLDKNAQDQVMNDFFRSEPTALGDIGYWNDHFYIKDVMLPEFLAEQIASRVRIDFRENKKLLEAFTLKYAKGVYISRPDRRYFRLEVLTEPKWFKELNPDAASDAFFEAVLKIASHVAHVYKFEDFEYIEVVTQNDGKVLKVSKEDLENFRTRKIKLEEIVT